MSTTQYTDLKITIVLLDVGESNLSFLVSDSTMQYGESDIFLTREGDHQLTDSSNVKREVLKITVLSLVMEVLVNYTTGETRSFSANLTVRHVGSIIHIVYDPYTS